jgi:hypothetical protein
MRRETCPIASLHLSAYHTSCAIPSRLSSGRGRREDLTLFRSHSRTYSLLVFKVSTEA